jgi:hypothetical protein
MQRWISLPCAILIFSLQSTVAPELRQVSDYHLHQPRDRKVLFAMSAAPNQDILVLVPTGDGKWKLSRVRAWLESKPLEETIIVPGLSDPRREVWAGPWEVKLAVTPSGRYAIASAVGFRSNRESVQIVSIVDLSAFQLLRTVTTSELPPFFHKSASIYFDSRGHLVLRSGSYINRGEYSVQLGLFEIPTFLQMDQCRYSEIIDGAKRPRTLEENCADLVRHSLTSEASLGSFLEGLTDNDEQRINTKPHGTLFISRDGRLGRGSTNDRRRGFFGGVVVSNLVEHVFWMKTDQELGRVQEDVSHWYESRFASKGSQDYLIVSEDGWRFRAYEIPTLN